jgi:hypothetical protein
MGVKFQTLLTEVAGPLRTAPSQLFRSWASISSASQMGSSMSTRSSRPTGRFLKRDRPNTSRAQPSSPIRRLHQRERLLASCRRGVAMQRAVRNGYSPRPAQTSRSSTRRCRGELSKPHPETHNSLAALVLDRGSTDFGPFRTPGGAPRLDAHWPEWTGFSEADLRRFLDEQDAQARRAASAAASLGRSKTARRLGARLEVRARHECAHRNSATPSIATGSSHGRSELVRSSWGVASTASPRSLANNKAG